MHLGSTRQKYQQDLLEYTCPTPPKGGSNMGKKMEENPKPALGILSEVIGHPFLII